MKIVVLSGKAYSGKSTIAKHLVANQGYRKISFADELKQDLLAFGFAADAILDKPPYMRELMIAYGKARRAEEPDYWIARLDGKIDAIKRYSDDPLNIKLVCDDCRFIDELEYFQRFKDEGHEVITIRVQRVDEANPISQTSTQGKDVFKSDQSETALDKYPKWDGLINVMSGDIPRLLEGADYIINDYMDPDSTDGPQTDDAGQSLQTPEGDQGSSDTAKGI